MELGLDANVKVLHFAERCNTVCRANPDPPVGSPDPLSYSFIYFINVTSGAAILLSIVSSF